MEEQEREELRESTSGEFEHQKRDNGTQVFREAYSEGAIERLKHLIGTSYKEGKKRFYAIMVDGERVVDKTCDVRKFDAYLKYRNPFTKMITVLMYMGYGFNCNRYEFTVVTPGLSGVSSMTPEEQIQKAIAEYKREQEYAALQKEIKKKNKKLKELKAIQEEIEASESGLDFEKVTGMVGQALGLVQQIKGGGGQPQLGGVQNAESEDEEDDLVIEPMSDSEEAPKKKKSEEHMLFKALFNDLGSQQIIEMVSFLRNMSEHPDLKEKFQNELDNKTNEEDGV